jgi:hypothetical protein
MFLPSTNQRDSEVFELTNEQIAGVQALHASLLYFILHTSYFKLHTANSILSESYADLYASGPPGRSTPTRPGRHARFKFILAFRLVATVTPASNRRAALWSGPALHRARHRLPSGPATVKSSPQTLKALNLSLLTNQKVFKKHGGFAKCQNRVCESKSCKSAMFKFGEKWVLSSIFCLFEELED